MKNFEQHDTKNHRLADARKKANLSQGSLAALAGFTSIEALRRYENYGLVPKQLIRERISEILGVPETDIWPTE